VYLYSVFLDIPSNIPGFEPILFCGKVKSGLSMQFKLNNHAVERISHVELLGKPLATTCATSPLYGLRLSTGERVLIPKDLSSVFSSMNKSLCGNHFFIVLQDRACTQTSIERLSFSPLKATVEELRQDLFFCTRRALEIYRLPFHPATHGVGLTPIDVSSYLPARRRGRHV